MEAEGRVRGVRVGPGGGDATVRRTVESGRAICGVRVWSRKARGDGSIVTERAGQGPKFDSGAATSETRRNEKREMKL